MTAPAEPQRIESWSAPHLEQRCLALRGSLLARGESPASLEAYAPGGAENPTTDPYGAKVVEYSLLRGRLAFVKLQEQERNARAQTALARALANTPVRVTLSDGSTQAVHPKSYHALAWCDALDRALSDVTQRALTLEDADVAFTAPLTRSLAVRLWAWILTHPEPGLPFNEADPANPPLWTELLTPEDLVALLKAHVQVHHDRMRLVSSLFKSEQQEAESRLSLSGFLGTVAQELHQRPSDVLTRWTMGEAFAQAVVAAEGAREARARAEEKARAKRAD